MKDVGRRVDKREGGSRKGDEEKKKGKKRKRRVGEGKIHST